MRHSDDVRDAASDEESYNDLPCDLQKHLIGPHTMDGNVTSSSIINNNPGTDFTNQLKQFENNKDMSEKNIRNKDFYYKEMMKSQGV